MQLEPVIKHSIVGAVTFVVVVSVLTAIPLGVVAQEQPAQETEPNDAPVGGTPVTTEEVTGTLDPASTDYDWYVIRADQGETIEATASFEASNPDAEFQMAIVAPNGTDLTSTNQAGEQVGVAAVAPTSGTYYIGVQSGYLAGIEPSRSLPYSLTVSPTLDTTPPSYTGSPDPADQPQSESEPNNARVGGAEIQDAPITGSLEPTGDDDWFAIQANAGERIEALVAYGNVGNNTYTAIDLVAPNGTTIVSNSELAVPRQQVAAIAQQSGTYYIHLSADRAVGAMPYSLTAFAASGQSDAATEAATQTPTPVSTEQATGDGTRTATTTAGTTQPDATAVPTTDSRTTIATTEQPTQPQTATGTPAKTPRAPEETPGVPAETSESSAETTGAPTSTITMIPTDTPSGGANASGANASNGTPSGNESGESGSSGPGFGITVAVVALLAATLLAVRRQ